MDKSNEDPEQKLGLVNPGGMSKFGCLPVRLGWLKNKSDAVQDHQETIYGGPHKLDLEISFF